MIMKTKTLISIDCKNDSEINAIKSEYSRLRCYFETQQLNSGAMDAKSFCSFVDANLERAFQLGVDTGLEQELQVYKNKGCYVIIATDEERDEVSNMIKCALDGLKGRPIDYHKLREVYESWFRYS